MEQQHVNDESERTAYEHAVLTAERERIAHELHHRVIGDLLALTMQIDSVACRVDGDAQARLVEIGRAVERIARNVRTTVFELSQPPDSVPLDPIMS